MSNTFNPAWVTAKERTPLEKEREYDIRWTDIEGHEHRKKGNRETIKSLANHELDLNVEWLDESPQPVPAPKVDAINYVCGFYFDHLHKRVVLIWKNKPKWQAGHLNGVGGKIEAGESPVDAMRREFKEETGIDHEMWHDLIILEGKDWRVYFFYAEGKANEFEYAETQESEEIAKIDIDKLDDFKHISNLRWLIPLALYKLRFPEEAMSFNCLPPSPTPEREEPGETWRGTANPVEKGRETHTSGEVPAGLLRWTDSMIEAIWDGEGAIMEPGELAKKASIAMYHKLQDQLTEITNDRDVYKQWLEDAKLLANTFRTKLEDIDEVYQVEYVDIDSTLAKRLESIKGMLEKYPE